MPVNDLITIRKGTASEWSSSNPVLASGELGFDLSNNILKIGDGSSAWNSLNNHSHTASNISNFNSSVSGLLPVTNITAGSGISVSSSSGNYTVNNTIILSYATTASFPATGSTSSYYLATDTSRLYQWTGSQYVEMGPPMTGFVNAQASINLYLWSNFR